MHSPPIFRVEAWVLAGATVFPAGKRASVFYAVFRQLQAVMVHVPAIPAYRNPVFANGKVVLVSQFDSAFFIQVNKRDDMCKPVVFVVRHCIMGGIKEQFRDAIVREKTFHSEKAIQARVGTTGGNRREQRENGLVTLGIGNDEHGYCRDTSSPWMNSCQYGSQAGRSTCHMCSQVIPFEEQSQTRCLRSLCEVTIGVPSPARAREFKGNL